MILRGDYSMNCKKCDLKPKDDKGKGGGKDDDKIKENEGGDDIYESE